MSYLCELEWCTIPNFSNYEINRNGDIRNKKTQRILKRGINHDGYVTNTLYGDDGKIHFFKVHRLVAELFLENPNNYTIVNHKDENRLNCNVNNLEWISAKQNVHFGNCKENMARSREILINEYSENGTYIRTWVSIKAISEYYHVRRSAIHLALCNGSMSCGHFFKKWNGDTNPIDVTNIKTRKPRIYFEQLGDIDPSKLFPVDNLSSIIDEIRLRERHDYVPISQARKDMFFLETYVAYLERALNNTR